MSEAGECAIRAANRPVRIHISGTRNVLKKAASLPNQGRRNSQGGVGDAKAANRTGATPAAIAPERMHRPEAVHQDRGLKDHDVVIKPAGCLGQNPILTASYANSANLIAHMTRMSN
jgi:hypothetical protein